MENDRFRWSLGFFLFVILSLECTSSEDPVGLSIDQVFDPNSGEVFLQRKYVVNVPAKSEECYFINDVVRGQKLNFHYLVRKFCSFEFHLHLPFEKVVSVQRSWAQASLDNRWTLQLESGSQLSSFFWKLSNQYYFQHGRAPPNKGIVYFSSRRVEGQLLGNEAKENGDFEICFINRLVFASRKKTW